MLLSIPTGRDLRGPAEKKANVGNVKRRLGAFKYMIARGVDILGNFDGN